MKTRIPLRTGILHGFLTPAKMRIQAAPMTNTGHEFVIKSLKEKGTMSKEKMRRIKPKTIKAAAGITKRLLEYPYLLMPVDSRARPAKTESRGQLWVKLMGMIRITERKRKTPIRKKKRTEKRKTERLSNFTAIAAQAEPRITRKNDTNTGTWAGPV
jgi:hypothetical protein